ncbi:hypothetical protein D3C87_2055230 [compost metagenome]
MTRNQQSSATLTTADQTVFLTGRKAASLQYVFTDKDGGLANLNLTIPVKPGGGCKRCATSDFESLTPNYFWGKLTYADQILYFKCVPAN